MKKFTAVLFALIIIIASSISSFAAGINSAERDVLDALQTSVEMASGTMVIPDEYINQAENYFNTIEMTSAESKEIIEIIEKGKNFLENTGAANIADMHYTKKYELLDIGKEVVGVIDMTMTYDKTTKTLYIYDPDGEVAFAATPYLTKEGVLADNNVIKPTGDVAGFYGVVVGSAIAVLLATGLIVFFVKTKKERV